MKNTENPQVKMKQIRDEYYDIQNNHTFQIQKMQSHIKCASERLETFDVGLKPLLTAFKTVLLILSLSIVNETSNEVRRNVRLLRIQLPLFPRTQFVLLF